MDDTKAKLKRWILLLLLGIWLSGCDGSDSSSAASGGKGSSPSSAASVSLTAAGSTFIAPAMTKWVEAYKGVNQDVSLNYQALGSGGGISNLSDGTVDFACADFPLDDKALAAMPAPVVQTPVTSGSVAIVYDIPNIPTGLKLSGDVLADIFLGKLTLWNDSRIAGQNPGTALPSLPIAVAHRSDGSGTTFIFSDYLSTISPGWRTGPGKNKDINWPVGMGGKGSAGVAGLVKQTQGGIGYVELAYATQNHMAVCQIQNKSGKYVSPSLESTASASVSFVEKLGKDLRTSIVNTPAADGYPIAGFTYAMLLRTPKDSAKGKATVDFLKWVLTEGQEMGKSLQYAPLPKPLADLCETQLGAVQAK